jgi:RNA polymerase sigma-70 factor (ECF subfamily)
MLNQCYDRLRRRPTQPLDAADGIADDAPSPDTGLDETVQAGAVARAVDGLPERQKAAILLCHFQERGNIEAAEIMGISVEALESLLARGRRTLRTQLAHLNEFAGDRT